MRQFSALPRHNQMEVLKKLDFKDFVNFKQCSRETVEIAKQLRHRLPLNVNEIYLFKDCLRINTLNELEYDSFKDEPVCFETEKLDAESSDEKMKRTDIQMADFVRKVIRKAEILDFCSDEHTDPSTLGNFVKILKATTLNVARFADLPGLVKQPEIGKLKRIMILFTEVGESNLLQLETPNIYICGDHGLTLSAINKFIKQWMENKRKVEQLKIQHIHSEEQHLEIFEGLDVSVEKIPRHEMDRITLKHIYSITRKDGKKLFVSIDRLDHKPRIGAGEHADLLSFVRFQYPYAEII